MPGEFYVMRLQRNESMDVSYGFLVHRAIGETSFGAVSRAVDASLDSPFFTALLLAYLGTDRDGYKQMSLCSPKKDPGTAKVFYWISPDRSLTFCPTSSESITAMDDAIRDINQVMPFVPRSIIFEQKMPPCALEISAISTTQLRSRVHLFAQDRQLPNAYHVTKRLIAGLAQRTQLLASLLMPIRFAITGECYSFGTNESESKDLPLASPDCRDSLQTVFCQFPSHLLVLSDERLDIGIPISTWSLHTTTRNDPVQVINQIAPDRVKCRYFSDLYVVELADTVYTVPQDDLDPVVAGHLRTEIEMFRDRRQTRIYDTFEQIVRAYEQELFESQALRNPIRIRTFSTPRPRAYPHQVCFGDDGVIEYVVQRANDILHCDTKIYKMGSSAAQVRLHNIAPGRDRDYTAELRAIFGECGLAISNTHRFPVVDIEIKRRKVDRLENDAFAHRVTQFLTHVGFFQLGSPRRPNPGTVITHVIGAECAGFVARGISDLFKHNDDISFVIPARMVHPALISFQPTEKLIENWLRQFKAPSIHRDGRRWVGAARDVHRIVKELRTHRGQIDLPFAAISLNCSMSAALQTALQGHQPARRWTVNRFYGVIVAPIEDSAAVRAFLEPFRAVNPDCLRGCVMFCDNPTVTSVPVTQYNRDGSRDTAPCCADCVKLALGEFTQSFFVNGTVDFDRLVLLSEPMQSIPLSPSEQDQRTHTYWPQYPLGQLLAALLADAEGTGPLAKAWMSGVLTNVLRNTPDCFTFCPEHPQEIIVVPGPGEEYVRCRFKQCEMVYCTQCFKWHVPRDRLACEDKHWDGPRCPNCRIPSEKISGCSHVQCGRCHKFWCYACAFWAETSQQVYDHIMERGH
jgi:hypothetical protein